MERYITINNTSPMEKYEDNLPKIESGPYIVDDSCFIPMSEAVRQLEVSSSSDISESLYDFPDGRDDGRQIPITRRKNCKDIAEVSSALMEDIDNISNKMSKDKKKAAEMAAFEAELKSTSKSDSTTTE